MRVQELLLKEGDCADPKINPLDCQALLGVRSFGFVLEHARSPALRDPDPVSALFLSHPFSSWIEFCAWE